jgi:hypothetical protein
VYEFLRHIPEKSTAGGVLGRVEEEQKVQGWDWVRSQPDGDGDSECLVGLELH